MSYRQYDLSNLLGSDLKETPNRFPAGPRIVVALKHFELVALDQIFPREQRRGDFLLFDQATQALRMDSELARRLNQVEIVVKRGSHRHLHSRFQPAG